MNNKPLGKFKGNSCAMAAFSGATGCQKTIVFKYMSADLEKNLLLVLFYKIKCHVSKTIVAGRYPHLP
jgi:hypothetical protein